MMEQLKGIHHVTAITSSAEKNYEFFTYTLGMRLVKKTVNQDDIQTYHLFFADDQGNPGTDMTFFDFPGITKGTHGTNEITTSSFRVPTDEAIEYWEKRFDRLQVKHDGTQNQFGRKVLPFVDEDGQMYQLVSDEYDEGIASGTPWQDGPIPLEYAITGLGPVHVRVRDFENAKVVLEKLFLFKEIDADGDFHLFEVGAGGNGARLIVEHNTDLPDGRQGYGTVHHLALRAENKDVLDKWVERMNSFQIPNSGFVERYYFQSLYIPIGQGILVEIATDGPGFMGDEPYETLGEKLSLPPFFEAKRDEIEGLVRHIDTVRSTKTFAKEYND